MAVIEEFVVVVVLLATGFTLRVLPQPGIAAPAAKNSSYGYDNVVHEENGAPSAAQFQQSLRADHGYSETFPRREQRRGARRGGPIVQLIGLARDRYQQR